MLLIHATSVLIAGAGVLIRGPSGSGKSDLALRLIDAGARLVADDQTEVTRSGATLVARAPAAIAGKLEVRGLGIVAVDAAPSAVLALAVDLVDPAAVERLPAEATTEILGLPLPMLYLAPFEASAPAKLRMAVACRNKAILAAPGPGPT